MKRPPNAIRPRDSLKNSTLVVAFSIGLSLASLVFVPIFYFLGGVGAAVFLSILIPLTASSVPILRATKSTQIASNYFLFWVWVLLTGVAIMLGERSSPAYPAYSLLVLGATFLRGRQVGILWTIVSILSIFAVYLILGQYQPFGIHSDTDAELLAVISVAAVLVLVGGFSLLYDHTNNRALAELRDANMRITRMIDKLELASGRLRSSSEELTGAIAGPENSLVGQMMRKARNGRETITDSRRSIDGMVAQYQRISERVHALYSQSEAIIGTVSTIDRISDRLDLMALNVGIEAAHGGEAGRQFGILATDMQFLAERVIQETKQIKAVLRQVHQQVVEVLDSSTAGERITEDITDQITLMIKVFDDIYELIEKAQGATGQMTTDALAQISAVRQLVSAAGGRQSGEP